MILPARYGPPPHRTGSAAHRSYGRVTAAKTPLPSQSWHLVSAGFIFGFFIIAILRAFGGYCH